MSHRRTVLRRRFNHSRALCGRVGQALLVTALHVLMNILRVDTAQANFLGGGLTTLEVAPGGDLLNDTLLVF